MLIFELMQLVNESRILCEKTALRSVYLERIVKIDFYLPRNFNGDYPINLLLVNDGQDLVSMDFRSILDQFYAKDMEVEALLCVGMHCSADRKMEYGIAGQPDYLGRGAKADLYTSFVFEELIPFIREKFGIKSFKEKAFAGFSLGGLMALDIVWTNAVEFSKVGVFSGSLWWRNIDQTDKSYDDDKHRIMHQQIRKGNYTPWLKFFFQCGNMDETKDRNNNGIIDSIDDTLDLIKELKEKGYNPETDIHYLELQDGLHNVPTWARAFPAFLEWGWGSRNAK